MGLTPRSLLQQQYEANLERTNPRKVKLIRAKPYTCGPSISGSLCFANGRQSIDEACPICGGTGYVGGNSIESDMLPLYATTYRITGDVQVGHGLYGAGGSYLKLVADLGGQDVGDATLFCKIQEIDRVTGVMVFPQFIKGQPKPDRIVSLDGTIYNVTRSLIAAIGQENIARIVALSEGLFSAVGSGGRA